MNEEQKKELDYIIEHCKFNDFTIAVDKFISKAIQNERQRLYNLLKKESFYYNDGDTDLEDKIIYFSDVDLIFNQ